MNYELHFATQETSLLAKDDEVRTYDTFEKLSADFSEIILATSARRIDDYTLWQGNTPWVIVAGGEWPVENPTRITTWPFMGLVEIANFLQQQGYLKEYLPKERRQIMDYFDKLAESAGCTSKIWDGKIFAFECDTWENAYLLARDIQEPTSICYENPGLEDAVIASIASPN